MAGKEQISLQL